MASPFHHLQTEVEGNHVPYNWVYVNSAARTGATGFIASDVGKLALQSDTWELYILTAITPTWVPLGGSSVADFTDLADVPANYSGAAGRAVAVNGTEDGLEFVAFPSGDHVVEDAVTDAVTDVVTLGHNSSGTPTDGFGTGMLFEAETSTTPDTPVGQINLTWRDATHASRLSEFNIVGYDVADPQYLGRIAGTTSSSTAPNVIGEGAVDFQIVRSSANQVAAGDRSFLGGGGFNRITSDSQSAAIVGGSQNIISSTSLNGAIVGGITNTISGAAFAGVVGGTGNTISASGSGIVGGSDNTITAYGSDAGIVGGENNTVGNTHSGIVGGYNNNVLTNPYSFVGGGTNNFVTGGLGAAVGGNDNLLYGSHAFVGGGNRNTVSGNYSVAFGTSTNITHTRTLALGGAEFFDRGDTQFLVTPISRSVTHNSSAWFPLFINGTSERLTIPNNTLWTFTVLISGLTSGAAKTFAFKIEGAIENDGGVTALLASTVTTIYDASDVSFDARVTADDTNDALLVEVSDSDGAGDVVRWFGTVLRTSVSF